MKAKILKALKDAGEEYVSGAVLCEKFGVSRQAIWKNIVALKETGYRIESVSNRGYRLVSSPDVLYGPEIESRLSENNICRKVLYFEEVDSTNIKLKQLAEAGEEEGLLVIADQQTSGKGRRGRHWNSEKGEGIYMSLLLRPRISPFHASVLVFITALVAVETIENIFGISAGIKWPNDVVINGKKICGILTEMSAEEGSIHYVVAGIGINANMEEFPEELKIKATSLFLETKKKTDRVEFTAEFLNVFDKFYKKFLEAGSLHPFLGKYNAALVNRGKEVKIYYGMVENAKPEEIETGIANGIAEDGALLVTVDGKEKRIVSGEVSVRGIMDYV